MMRPYKFQIVPVAQVVDDQGNVAGEVTLSGEGGQPLVLYGCDAVEQFARDFPDQLNKAPALPD